MSMRRFVVVLALVGLVAAPVLAQEEEIVEANAEASHEGGHETELQHLQIHGIADVFVISEDLPDQVREEREKLRTQLVAAFINFGVLIYLLVAKAGPKIHEGLVERRASIAKDIEEAARLKAEAEAKHAEYKKRLAQLDAELAEIREDMSKAGKLEAERIVAEAQAKAERTRRETEFLIEQRMKSLRDELSREAVVGAIAAAEGVLREKTTADDQTRLSRAYAARLGEIGKEGRA